MLKIPALRHSRHVLAGAIATLLCGLQPGSVNAASFSWTNVTGNFIDGTKWLGNIAPTGTDATDILTFAGNVGTIALPTSYTATDTAGGASFLINQLVFNATDANPGAGPVDIIAGTTPLLLGGVSPTINQTGSAGIDINAPIILGANLTLSGTTVTPDPNHINANITLNGAISGAYDITKSGTSTFRFGSLTNTSSSSNAWYGSLIINDGTIRFNNNAYTASTALHANPVVMNSANALLTTLFKPLGVGAGQDPISSLRFGTLSGTAGTVTGQRTSATAGSFDSIDIVITAVSSGSFAGTVKNTATGVGDATGKLTIRGVGTQTFTGTLTLAKDVEVSGLATMVVGGSATLGAKTSGSIILGGGTFRLDNTTTNNNNRLRDGDPASTGVDNIGGGTLSLVGNATGTTETAARVELGSASNSRSGALTINVTHTSAGASTFTQLNFQSYQRDVATAPLDTVNFTGSNAAGTPLALGGATNGPRITFTSTSVPIFTVPVFNGLIGNTGTADATTVGWATVNGTDFAGYGATGIIATTTVAPPDPTTAGDATKNALLATSTALSNASGYAINSLKFAPADSLQTLDIATTGTLRTGAFLLAGANDFAINASGGGSIANAGSASAAPRYFHVPNALATLTVNAGLNGVQAPIVKSGLGALVLTNGANNLVNQPVVINEGTLRATPGTSLPSGELRIRGGVIEITGGGTFSRLIGLGQNKITWSGIDGNGLDITQERGSGGFAAVGQNATVHLTPVVGTDMVWEDLGFVTSGYALVFGSTHADAKLTWVDNIGLTPVSLAEVNYNAREFRAIDNTASTNDVAVLSGSISGTVRNDFLKSGNGELILSGNNTFQGATILTDGTLRVNGSDNSSYITDVRSGATLGGSGSVAAVQVQAGGSIAPGDLIGHASILATGDFKLLAPTAKLTIELGGNTAGGNGVTGYDRVNVTGGITLGGGQLVGSLLNGFTPAASDLFFIMVNDGTDAVQGTFAQGAVITIGAQNFAISYTGNFTGNPATDTFTGGNDVVLRLVPEPATAGLMLLGTLALAARRRRA